MNRINLTVGGLFWVMMVSFAAGIFTAAKFSGCTIFAI